MRSVPVALLLLLACACARGGEPTDRAQHLDPRLADGRASARVLAARETALEPGAPLGRSGASWSLMGDGAAVLDGPGGAAQGTRLRIESTLWLDHRGAVDAGEVDAVELELDGLDLPPPVRLVWRCEGDGEHHALEQRAERRDGLARVRFELAHAERWAGRIELVRLFVDAPDADVTLHGPRLLRLGFTPGLEAAEPGGRAEAGDGGLVALGGEAVRAWPADLGTYLFDRARIPRGGALTATLAAGSLGARPRALAFAVDVRPPGGEWRRAGRRLVPAEDPAEGRRWHSACFELGQWAGRWVELRLVARAADASDAEAADHAPGVEPARAAALWGAPTVVGTAPEDGRPHVLLITVDTARADVLFDAACAPRVAQLAREGTRFTSAWSACNATTPSHASILTGLHLKDHAALHNRAVLAPENRTLAECLRAAGYRTAAAVSVDHIEAGAGFGQGFDRFWQAHPRAYRDGRPTLDAALRFVGELADAGGGPTFLWVHLFDPHTPYGPPRAFTERWADERGRPVPPERVDPPTLPVGLEENAENRWLVGVDSLEHVRFLYDAGVAYTDALVGELVDAYRRTGWLDRAVVCLVADHGEFLGERGQWFNHRGIFPEVMRVPLVLRLPPGARGAAGARGATLDHPVSALDVAPTLLGAAGVAVPSSMGGADLLDDRPRTVWFEYTRRVAAGCFDGRYYFLKAFEESDEWPPPSHRLFDLAADPGLTRDLSQAEPEAVAERLAALEAWNAAQPGAVGARAIERATTSEEEQRLESLGYAGDE